MAKIDDSVKKKVPELRFKGFTDEWEERKFKDNIVSIQTGTNLLGSAVNEGTPLIKMGNLQRGYFSFKKLEYLDSNNNVGSEDIVNYGDFLFNTRNTLELVGKGATWTGISGKYAFNSNIARFKFDGIDTIFFNYLYNTQQVISQVHARAVGTTSVSAVYPRDLNSLLYYLPSIEEQQKIGSFFKQLDDTIALHQRKLDLLKEQKKGYLQKMFPKNGAKVPELRFAGFADDWEERKLGDLSQDTIGGGTPKTSVTEYWNGEIPWIQSSDLANDKLYGVLPKKFITEDAVKNSATKLIPANSIAIVTRVGVGKLAFMPYEFASSQDFLSLSNIQVDCNFGMYSIYKMLQRELNNIQGTSIKGITKADLLDKETFVPIKVEEQQKIGAFFKQLDDTIALHQRKLDLLKEQKKGFLQKMFV